ncbi:type II toxin-antitoxin system VapC family toxin [Leptolyngbyaceae cyanobacterium UHCC 1019]
MNGSRYLLDTNAIIALLQGNQQVSGSLQNAEWIGISLISQLEFLAFTRLTDEDRQLFEQFLQQIEVIGLSAEQNNLITQIVQVRQQYRLPLPDAIIVATAIQMNANLVTADQKLHEIQAVTSINFT